jgi:hypothetical protein
MVDPSSNLRKRLHFLRNRAPDEFKEVQLAMNAWAGTKLAMVTGLSPDQLPQFQGQMQGIESILTLMKDSETKPND